MSDILTRAGFVDSYLSDSTQFYSKYFDSTDEMYVFFENVFRDDSVDKTPRLMMNQTRRLVTLAYEAKKLHPDYDVLAVSLLQTCIESLHKIAQIDDERKNFFVTYLTDKEMTYITESIEMISFGELSEIESVISDWEITSLSMEDIALLFYELRNKAFHEGIFWDTQIFKHVEGYPLITGHTIREKDKFAQHYRKIYNDRKKAESENLYCVFETSLDLDEFVSIFVKACIRFITKYTQGIAISQT